MKPILTTALCVALSFSFSAHAQSEPKHVPYQHDTCEKAVSFGANTHSEGIEKEYQWLSSNLPGHAIGGRKLVQCPKGPADVFAMVNEKNNTYFYVVFDLTQFFGKGF